ncbi:CvpA family protein [Betaproteobacteria bacterium]|nr:CvpA family protein [Betaproteobacteria bacterium]
MIDEFTWIDIVVFVILSSSFLLSILRGLVYEISSIVVWGLSIFCAYNFGFYFSAIFPDYLSPELRTVLGSLLVLLIIILLSKMVVLSLKEIIEKSGGGSLDKIFGAFFGMLRGGLIVVALSLLGTMTALTQEEAWMNAKTRVYLEYSVIQTIPYLPKSVVDKIKIDFKGRHD